MPSALRVGADPLEGARTRFVVWAPERRHVAVTFPGTGRVVDLAARADGYFAGVVDECAAGTRYQFLLDDDGAYADPASRSQPDGVHGPSEVVDLGAHAWADAGHRTRPLHEHVLYEVHIGTLTPSGTFDAAIEVLDELVEVGVSAVELMPVAQFPGVRNWGYDGVFPFAVQSSYGGPAGLQRFVEACHGRGLDVVLDVVYNHLGPEGNVLEAYAPYFTARYRTPWGPAINFDGPGSDDVRAFFVQNAHQWFCNYHVDGLRLDAVHEIFDHTARPFLAELAESVGAAGEHLGRPVFLVAESADNDPRLVRPLEAGGLGLGAQWNDDFHHAVHAAVTGEGAGYYVDYGAVADIARAMDEGFVYQGEYSCFRRRNHGAPSGAIPPERLVVFAQNHDQIGNRPRGDRLVSLVTFAQAQLVSALVLLAPGVPLLFMGEEYGDPAPFPYFIDHGDPALTEAVRAGRARELAVLPPSGEMPAPAADATFRAARLDRSLRHQGTHRAQWALHRALIELRRANPALRRAPRAAARAQADGRVLTMVRSHPDDAVVALFNVSAERVEGVLPAVPQGWAGDESACWTKVVEAAAPEFGGSGELLPAARRPGERTRLGPWEFCVYHLARAAPQ